MAPDPRFPALEASPDSALELGRQLREVVGGPDMEAWLRARAAWPLDFDGGEPVEGPEGLPRALEANTTGWGQGWQLHTQCVWITRQELLAGDKPWPWLDRLGKRPPVEELARDLDRLGLREKQWLVNCYHGQEAGYELIVEPDEANHARVRAIRD